jgi:hypothetical protein
MSTEINIAKSIKVLDEGVLLTPDVSQIDFTGISVTASASGNNVTVNVRNLPSVQSVVSAATVTPTANDDLVVITAQAAALTLAAPTGSLVQGQALMIRIKDDGTARGITWTSGAGGYRAIGITLPTTTVISKTTYVGLIYNSTDSRWDAIGVTTEA